MNPKRRPIIVGAVAALLVVAAAVGAMLAFNRLRPPAPLGDPSKVVVVFALPGEDEAVTAHLVAVVDPKAAPATYKVVDASSTVTLPGTSYTTLRDAYPFGGAEAVAKALEGGALEKGTAWVEVSPAAWTKLVQAGVEVSLTANFDTFDGERFAEFPKGPQTVAAVDLRAFMNGLAYLARTDRDPAVAAVAAESLKGLSASTTGPPPGVTTNLSGAGWSRLSAALR